MVILGRCMGLVPGYLMHNLGVPLCSGYLGRLVWVSDLTCRSSRLASASCR